jgi:hypothetical protein
MTLDNWSTIADEVVALRPWAAPLFIAFIVVSFLFSVGLIVAITCETVQSVKHDRVFKTLDVGQSNPEALGFPATSNNQNLKALELKVDQLSDSVDQLLRMQRGLQDSLLRLAQQTSDGTLQGQTSLR